MIQLFSLVEYANRALKIKQFKDYCPNGLQVEGRSSVNKVVSAVTASVETIEAALEAQADVLMVHHGYFWKGDSLVITGLNRRRIGLILENNLSLLAYHLPLDAHPLWGNNAQLADILGLEQGEPLNKEGIGLTGKLTTALSLDEFSHLIETRLNRTPQVVSGGDHVISSIGWCTGAAQDYISQAAEMGLDAFLSGEISERTYHQAREYGIHYIAAGHHATERYGVQAFGSHLAQHFDITHQFIEIDNPV